MCNGEFIGMNKQTVESMFINLIRRLVDTRTLCKILRGCHRRLLNTATQLLPRLNIYNKNTFGIQ